MDFNLSFHSTGYSQKQSGLDSELLYDLLIIGAGPAGLNAALYGKRKGLNVGVLGKRKGGQVVDTSFVDNYMGMSAISGEELMRHCVEHVEKYAVPLQEDAEIADYYPTGNLHNIVLSTGETHRAKALVVATGAAPRKLDVPGETAYAGKGVAYCAICDAPLFKDKNVFVAGGGNSAVEAVLDLSKFARTVTLVHRSKLRADQILIDLMNEKSNIKISLNTRINEIVGKEAMTGLRVADSETGEERILPGDGIFIEIGLVPSTKPFHTYVNTNEQGEIVTSSRMETNVPGIFSAGDVTDSPYKQIITAMSSGAIAALAANDYINQTHFEQ